MRVRRSAAATAVLAVVIVAGALLVRGTADTASGSTRPARAQAMAPPLARGALPLLPARLVPGIPPERHLARGVHRFAPPAIPSGVAAGTVDTLRFFSPALGRMDEALVYLPPGYLRSAAQGRRYPVLYILHGSPSDGSSVFDGGWAGRDASVLIAEHLIRPMIIVAPYGLYGRTNNTQWADGRRGRYLAYVADVVHAVDTSLATLRARRDRVIAGDSEGGFGAANVALHDLSLFGGFQSWSGYFTQMPAGTFAGASRATIAANSPLDYVASLSPQIRRLGLHAYVYAGARDAGGRTQVPPFVAALRAAGAGVGGAIYPGGHNWTLWRSQMPHMLELASSWFSTAR
jgi:enterochelin esterase-like enzyme